MNPLTKFLALMLACIVLMSFLMTGMFYYVHANETNYPRLAVNDTALQIVYDPHTHDIFIQWQTKDGCSGQQLTLIGGEWRTGFTMSGDGNCGNIGLLSEFPSTTITNTTIATGGAPELTHTGIPISTAPTVPVQTRAVSDYGLIALTFLVILAGALFILIYYKKK